MLVLTRKLGESIIIDNKIIVKVKQVIYLIRESLLAVLNS